MVLHVDEAALEAAVVRREDGELAVNIREQILICIRHYFVRAYITITATDANRLRSILAHTVNLDAREVMTYEADSFNLVSIAKKI